MLEIEKALNELGRKVIRDSRLILKKHKKADSTLYKEIDYSVNKGTLTFSLPDYWEYVDAGVKGVGGSKKSEKGVKLSSPKPWKVKKVTNNKFKYRKKRPPFMALNGWSIKKKIAPRNKKGQFMSRKSILFAIANSIYHTGIATTDFFSEPFETNIDAMMGSITEALTRDLIKNIQQ